MYNVSITARRHAKSREGAELARLMAGLAAFFSGFIGARGFFFSSRFEIGEEG